METQPRPADGAELHDVLEHAARAIDGNRKAETDGAATAAREDERVYADHFARGVDEGPPGVSRIDGRVGLDHPRPHLRAARAGLRPDVAADRADHSDRNGGVPVGQQVAERIADRDRPFTDQDVVRVAERSGGEVPRIDLEDGEVRYLVRLDQLGGKLPAVHEGDDDLGGIGDDMLVGEDVAVRGDDEPRSQTLDLP